MRELLERANVRRILATGALLIGWLLVLLVLNAAVFSASIAVFPPGEAAWSGPVIIIGILSVLGSIVLFGLAVVAAVEILGDDL